MDIKNTISGTIDKVKKDPNMMKKLQSDPVKALEEITGQDLPDDKINGAIDSIKSKVGGKK